MSKEIYKNSNPSKELVAVKHRGKIFTPDYLVNVILDQADYKNAKILKKHIIDNSCGDGQFILHFIERYCNAFLKNCDGTKNDLKKELETYVHAIEIDKEELDVCISRCDKLVEEYGLKNVKWDFVVGDTLKIEKYNNKMDFVIGNPPYVRVHNLKEDFEKVKGFVFSNGGMTDLFITFYELGLRMLNEKGVLCYITPSSFFTSLAGKNMRNYIVENKLLESLCDLKHFQPFNATTYTAIVCLNKGKNNEKMEYYEFDSKLLKPYKVESLKISDYNIDNNFYFSKLKNIELLKKIIYNKNEAPVAVKNGYATLADKVFIGDFEFKSKYVIPALKASRGKWTKIIYPYDKNSKLISWNDISKDNNVANYLIDNRANLNERDSERDVNSDWYAFGRSQAINDTYKDKLSINALIRTSDDLKLIDVPSGSGVYSGLYIVTQEKIDINSVKEALQDKEFGIFISLLAKYKSGGYYTFSSKDVKYYLNYKIGGLQNVK